MGEFSDLHRAVIDFERRLWVHAGRKDAAIMSEFGFGPTRFYQLLSWAIDQPEALRHHAPTVHRLRRLRDKRLQARRDGFYGRAG